MTRSMRILARTLCAVTPLLVCALVARQVGLQQFAANRNVVRFHNFFRSQQQSRTDSALREAVHRPEDFDAQLRYVRRVCLLRTARRMCRQNGVTTGNEPGAAEQSELAAALRRATRLAQTEEQRDHLEWARTWAARSAAAEAAQTTEIE